ncbi:protein JOKA2 isoform X2 [Hevea brasiliensis]|uniref:protein JOKA2 isoform X2 n=1 Tax=Hevea brasiliensis TaxID=3981 RepID=UPI0025EC4C28|nr:protein JOKA2 isoform X2 [Hevea brasiliensis]
MESTLVIKVKYGDTLRRFNAHVNKSGQIDFDMSGLRAKILGLFNFPLNSDLTLTYVDEDGDVVTLVDDDDLLDVMKQSLKFLRVNVQLNNDRFGKSYAKSCGSSSPLRSPRVQDPLPNINPEAADVLKSFPEPLRESLSKLSLGLSDLTSKIVAPSPVVAEILDCLSKMGKASLNPSQQSQVGASSSAQTGATEHPMALVVPTEANATNDEPSREVTVANVTRGVGVPDKPVLTPVDLNLDPPCDSNPSGCANVISAPAPHVYERKVTKKKNAGQPSEKPFGSGASSSSTDLARPLGNECPFGGMPAVNESSFNPFILPQIISSRRSNGRSDAMVGMFHRGVQCDGCGVHPITGPRYKSKVRGDYDLCSICFAKMGNEADYIKMDRPVFYRHPRSCKGLRDLAQKFWVAPPPLSRVMKHCGIKPVRANKLDSRFILDVTVVDGTMMAPSTPFTKIWRLRNSGSIVWPKGARLVWIGGDRFSHADSAELEIPADGVPVDGELDIAVDFTAPELPGRYISYWRMASPSGTKFGQRVWVLIQVDASIKDSVSDGVGGLNLNLPPDCGGSKCPQIIDVNLQPVMDSGLLGPCNSSSLSVPMVDVEQPEKDQELNFPTNDTLLVGEGVWTPTPNQASSSVSYPIIDLSEAAPVVPSEALPAVDIPTSPEEVIVKDAVEKSLLKELEEMGFKQIDLNKEILRKNEYNLQQSVDDLSGVWDPILEELEEMGFSNKETNRNLLKKNNGSIKRVVMDLLTGEKA